VQSGWTRWLCRRDVGKRRRSSCCATRSRGRRRPQAARSPHSTMRRGGTSRWPTPILTRADLEEASRTSSPAGGRERGGAPTVVRHVELGHPVAEEDRAALRPRIDAAASGRCCRALRGDLGARGRSDVRVTITPMSEQDARVGSLRQPVRAGARLAALTSGERELPSGPPPPRRRARAGGRREPEAARSRRRLASGPPQEGGGGAGSGPAPAAAKRRRRRRRPRRPRSARASQRARYAGTPGSPAPRRARRCDPAGWSRTRPSWYACPACASRVVEREVRAGTAPTPRMSFRSRPSSAASPGRPRRIVDVDEPRGGTSALRYSTPALV